MPKPTSKLADVLEVAISPILVMLLVGSLAFFLIQVFYRGAMVHGIRWLMFWFVLAIVLVSRIGIERSKGHARSYGAALALVAWFYLAQTHGTVGLGALLLAVTWWCAHQLTVDCTWMSEDEDALGEGVLQGWWSRLEKAIIPPPAPPKLPPLPVLDVLLAANLAKRRSHRPPRPPGRTVVWFSLAALPLFGIGQLFLPADDPHARRVGFALLAVYLGAALSLLATTSFLGLRRYLRRRAAEMPSSVTLAWMKFGAFLAAGVLLLALILPRPGANHTWKDLTYRIEPKRHQASDYALPFNPPGDGDGMPSDAPSEREPAATDSRRPVSGNGGGNPRRENRPQPNPRSHPDQAAPSDRGGGRGGHQGSSGDQGSEGQPGDNTRSREANDTPTGRSIRVKDVTGPAGADDSSDNDQSSARDNPVERNRGGDGNRSGGTSAEPSPDRRQTKAGQPKQRPKAPPQVSTPDKQPEPEQPPNPTPTGRKPGDFLVRLLRVLVLVALAALLGWFLVRKRKAIAGLLRSFLKAVREFFRKLFAIRWRRKPRPPAIPPAPAPALEPFASYENPFVAGKDKTWSPDRLLCYTYEAVCAWAKERRTAIRPQETPREFCLRLLERLPDVGEDLETFSCYYTHVAFARRLPDDFETESIRRLWQCLGDAIPMGVSR